MNSICSRVKTLVIEDVPEPFDFEKEEPTHPDERSFWKFKLAKHKDTQLYISTRNNLVLQKIDWEWILVGMMKDNKIVPKSKLSHSILLWTDMCGIRAL